MFGLKAKTKSAPKARNGLYVVVGRHPDFEPFVGFPRPRDEALRVFDGVIRHAPPGELAPDSGSSVRVVPLAHWNQARLAEALLEA